MNKLIALLILAITATTHADLLFQDDFSYANGLTTNVSGGLWARNSGTADNSFVGDGNLQVYGSRGDDVNRSLGTTYTNGTANTLFYSMTFSVTNLPTAAGTYVAHFLVGVSHSARLTIRTTGAATVGNYVLGIGEGSSILAFWDSDLVLNQSYQAVVGVNLATHVSTLWIDPTDINSTSYSYTNNPFMNVGAMAFRQAAGGGDMLVDSVAVGTDFNSVVVPEPGTLALLGIGFGALMLRRRRQA